MSFWQGIERPTQPASTPYTNEQLKAAFFKLLSDTEKFHEHTTRFAYIIDDLPYVCRFCAYRPCKTPQELKEYDNMSIEELKASKWWPWNCEEKVLQGYVEKKK